MSSENLPAINTLYYVKEKKLQLHKSRWKEVLIIVLIFSKAVVAFFPLLFLVKFTNLSLVSSSKLWRTVWFHLTAHFAHRFKVWFTATNLEIVQKNNEFFSRHRDVVFDLLGFSSFLCDYKQSVKSYVILLFLYVCVCVCFHVRTTCVDFMQIWKFTSKQTERPNEDLLRTYNSSMNSSNLFLRIHSFDSKRMVDSVYNRFNHKKIICYC